MVKVVPPAVTVAPAAAREGALRGGGAGVVQDGEVSPTAGA